MACMSRAEEDDTNGQAQQVCEFRVVQVLQQGTNDRVIMLHRLLPTARLKVAVSAKAECALSSTSATTNVHLVNLAEP